MKDKTIMLRVSENEKKSIEEQASKEGLKMSQYLMMLHYRNKNKEN